jgi:hypothetical protein
MAPISLSSTMENNPVLSTPKVGNSLDIRVDNLVNALPKVAYNSQHNEFLVVWEEQISSAEVAIYGQRVGPDGILKGGPIEIRKVLNTIYHSPSVAYSPVQDKFLVVYRHNYKSDDYDIWAIQVSWDGSSKSAEFPIDRRLGLQWASKVTYNTQSDEYLILYEDFFTANDRRILATRVKASDLSTPGSQIQVAYVSGQSRRLPDVAYNVTRNEYLIAYTHTLNVAGTLYGIKGKIVPADLSSIPTNEIAFTANDQCNGVSLAAGPNEFLAVWSENVIGGPQKIWGRRVIGDGTLGSFIKFADRAPENCVEPVVAYEPFWGYFLSWRYVSPGGIWDIFGRTIGAGQNTPSSAEFPISYISYSGGGTFIVDGQQKGPAVACGAMGICLAAYEDNCCIFNSDYEIRGRLVTPNFLYLPLIERN